jgi:type VI protein secretion system component Hcp
MAVDAFLKFEGFEGRTHKLGNDFDRLGDSFSDLGGAFIKLVDNVSSTDVNFFKADLAAHIKHDVFTIGDDFFKIGQEFIKLTGPLDTFGNTVVKFTDQFVTVTPSASEGGFPLATDFLKFETDLKATGLDFLSASDIKAGPTENLSLTFNKIAIDYTSQSDDVLKLGEDFADFIKISGVSESSKVGETFLKITLETVLVSSADLKLSTDFQKISTDIAEASDSGLKAFDQVALKYASDFVTLAQDLKFADGAFTALGGDFVKLADAIQHPGPTTTPTIT